MGKKIEFSNIITLGPEGNPIHLAALSNIVPDDLMWIQTAPGCSYSKLILKAGDVIADLNKNVTPADGGKLVQSEVVDGQYDIHWEVVEAVDVVGNVGSEPMDVC